MMQHPGDSARDNEPSRSSREGSVVLGGHGISVAYWNPELAGRVERITDGLRAAHGSMTRFSDAVWSATEAVRRGMQVMTPEADALRLYEQCTALDANEELIRSTRAEFDPARDPLPVQPFGAGDAMRWSPPPDGEETPSCPA